MEQNEVALSAQAHRKTGIGRDRSPRLTTRYKYIYTDDEKKKKKKKKKQNKNKTCCF